MSDLSIYELDDIVWDDFCQTDDHIVPHPNYQSLHSQNRKRPRRMPDQQSQNKKRYSMMEKEGRHHIAADSTMPGQRFPDQRFECVDIDSTGDGELRGDGSMLGDITQSQDDRSFLDTDQDQKESNDLFYSWPDIENFEDVDRMFRSCDSSFGLGGADNEDELGWFSSSDNNIEGSENTLKSELKFLLTESNGLKAASREVSNLTNESCSINDSRSAVASCNNASSSPFAVDKPTTFRHLSYLRQGSETNHNLTPDHQLDIKNRQQNQEAFDILAGGCPPQPNVGPYSFCYQQTNTPYMHLDYSQTTVVKSENDSFASKHPIRNTCQDPISDPVQVMKEVHLKNSGDVERVDLGILGDLSSSSAHESSLINSSKFYEISLEATSFRQLRQVVEQLQLDLKTKMCIRDSLYRLAKSAEQRHNFAKFSGDDDRDSTGTLLADETNKHTRFVDIETGTNPIDRTVAHLLFHRAPDLSLMSNVMIHGPIADQQPTLVENIVGLEERSAKVERLKVTHGKY